MSVCLSVTNELLQEVFIGFCSDGASVMLVTKSGVGKLLKNEFPDIVLWHCLNNRLELAVGNALDSVVLNRGDVKKFLGGSEPLHALQPVTCRQGRQGRQCLTYHNLEMFKKN